MRAQVIKSVKSEAVKNLYKSIFAILAKGTTVNGDAIGNEILAEGNLPSQKINDFTIEVAATLGETLNKVIDIILPDDFDKIASAKLSIQGKASAIDV